MPDPNELTPKQIVAELDKYIVGQAKAKRAVAIALRNRYRREQLPADLRKDVIPKNILMIGPTGVGKTEIARRIATLTGAPFVKVEATKYTEVGYVGRDVESMVRDLAEAAIRMVRDERIADVKEPAAHQAIERIIDILHPETCAPQPQQNNPFAATLGSIFGNSFGAQANQPQQQPQQPAPVQAPPHESERIRTEARNDIERGFYDVRLIEIEVEEQATLPIGMMGGGDGAGMGAGGGDMSEMLSGLLPKKRAKKRVTVSDARRIFAAEEEAKLIDMDAVKREALRRAGERGIIFIDEIDKIATREGRGVDVSREGVQRDILPIVEGSTVNTKYGPLATDHVLFVAAGAFHMSKPSDLIPELQGRFPIRVELDSLTAADFETILTQPKNALMTQYTALLAADGVKLDIRPDAIAAIARFATEVNERDENIGARRLHTVLERVFEEIGFAAPEVADAVTIDGAYVSDRLSEIAASADLSNFIL
jgi:ATP-dependent HslUV protease ATP-binding subunit HslU